MRVSAAMKTGDKRDFVNAPWAKVNFDRQIVAIALTEGASAIYSTDRDIHNHAAIWGLPARHLGDVQLAERTLSLFEDTGETGQSST